MAASARNGDNQSVIAGGEKLLANLNGGPVKVLTEIITMAATDTFPATITCPKLPKGAVPLFLVVTSSVTVGATATIAVGILGDLGKYRVAATKANALTEVIALAAAVGVELTAEEQILITTGVANLPAGGTLQIQLFYSTT